MLKKGFPFSNVTIRALKKQNPFRSATLIYNTTGIQFQPL